MDLRRLHCPEHISPSNRRFLSIFLVFFASFLFFSVVLPRNAFKISSISQRVHSSPFPWFSTVPNAPISSSSSVPANSRNSMDLLPRSGEERVSDKTHEGKFPESAEAPSFLSFNGGERAIVKTNEGGMVAEKTLEGNFSKIEENSNIPVEEEWLREITHEGNFSLKDKNANFSSEEERIRKNTHELNATDKDKVAAFYNGSASVRRIGGFSQKCNIFNGRWVRDEGKPYYPVGSCPYIDQVFNCFENGRPDNDFLRWRWQPNDCDIPSFNATDFLERLRGKRLLFIGDSLSRNMWESLVCMLRHSVVNKSRVHEVSGRSQFKAKGYYNFRYEDHNCSIEFVTSPFLVRLSSFSVQNRSEQTLRLDLMDETASSFQGADVLVFNTGHWWTHEKTSKGVDYYQEGNYVYPKLKVKEAYKKALTTWARWVDTDIDANRTQVVFRGYSVSHFRGGRWNSGGKCDEEKEPVSKDTNLQKYPWKMKVLEQVLKDMRTPVIYLNISRLTAYRKDGHPSIYKHGHQNEQHPQDCSHWCLPGIPDTWNELLYASLVMDQ